MNKSKIHITKVEEFPMPLTEREAFALEKPHEEYVSAKRAKEFGAAVALLASTVIGVDTLTDHDVGPVSMVSAPIAGVMASKAIRERGKQQRALEEARSVVEISPSDLPIIRHD
jgi:hypothetical protein